MSIEVKFNRLDKTYNPGDRVSGVLVATCEEATKHAGITLNVTGFVTLILSARNMGLYEAFSSNMKPLQLVNYTIPIAPAGKLPAGTSELPFEFILKPVTGQQLHDTYHGVYVNVRYHLTVDMAQGMFGGPPVQIKREFYVQLKREDEIDGLLKTAKSLAFTLTPASLQNVRETARKKVPEFLFIGHIDSTVCPIEKAFTGEITIKTCVAPIKSIAIQLARVESCVYPSGVAREATEIQNIQVADGDVLREVPIPLHMVLPRHFTCSTTISKTFRIEFQINLIVLFEDNHMITENFPIILVR